MVASTDYYPCKEQNFFRFLKALQFHTNITTLLFSSGMDATTCYRVLLLVCYSLVMSLGAGTLLVYSVPSFTNAVATW